MPGYFIDTSALAKLYHIEVGSQKMEALAESPDARLIVSQLSLIEIQSVFHWIRPPSRNAAGCNVCSRVPLFV